MDDTGTGAVCEATPAPSNGVEPLDEDCTEDGLAFCSNTEAEGPAGSRYWICTGGAWVEESAAGDEICVFDGFDFAYGCIDDGTDIFFECGTGSGADCSGPECNECLDSDVRQLCSDGKASTASCFELCTVLGDDKGVTYDFGECIDGEAGPDCACCDDGDKGCVIK